MSKQQSRKELEEIIKRYLAGSASPEETRFVESYFSFVENKSAKENPVSEDLTAIGSLFRVRWSLFRKGAPRGRAYRTICAARWTGLGPDLHATAH